MGAAESTGLYLSVDVCPHGVRSVAVNLDGGGSRVFGPKCCGITHEEFTFPTSPDNLREAAAEFEEYASDAERHSEGE